MAYLYFLENLRHPVLDVIFSLITLLGEETLFMAVGMIVFWCVDKYKGYYLLFVGFIGTVLNQFLKILCRVPRPWIRDPNFTIVESARKAATGYSFPSGHTQVSAGLFGGIARMTNSKVLYVVMLTLATLVAFSRMYLGVHTPLDVLVSVALAALLVLVGHPLFEKAKEKPKFMFAILFSFVAIVVAYLCFVLCFPLDAEPLNLRSAQKNGYTLLGCAVGLVLTYAVDLKWIHFETKAAWWAQIIKVVGGLALVLAAKELLKAPLDTIFDGHLAARAVRYFLMVVVGGILWPMTFRLVRKKE